MKKMLTMLASAFLAVGLFVQTSNATQIVAIGNHDWFEVRITHLGTGDASFTAYPGIVLIDVQSTQVGNLTTVNIFWDRTEGLGGIGPVNDLFTIQSPYQPSDVSGSEAARVQNIQDGLYFFYGVRGAEAPDETSVAAYTGVAVLAAAGFRRFHKFSSSTSS